MKLPQDVSGEELAKALGMRFINYGARTADGGRGMTEGHYGLPKGWKWVRLGEVAQVKYGKAKPPESGSIPVVGSGGVYAYTKTPLVSNPTVIVGRKGSAGEPLLMREPCWPSDTTFYLVWKFDIHAEWVALWLALNKPSPTGTSATLPSIRRQDLESLLLPLPPLPEQRRIVARIEELMERVREAKRLREEAKKDADRLMQAALAEVFPRPGAPLSPGWKLVKLGEVVVQCIGGTWGTGDDPDGVGVLRPNNIGENGEIVWEDIRWRNVSVSQLQKRRLRDGDIILTKSNSLEQVGRAALFQDPNDDRTYVPSNFLQLLRPDPSIVQPEYLHYILRTRQYVAFVQRTAIGSSASLKNLSARALKEFRFPLPPLVEQRRIVAYLDQLQARMTALQKAQESTEAELHRLEQTILDKAFRGEL